MKSPKNETLSRWVWRGVPLLIGIGIAAAVALRLSFRLSVAKLTAPITVLLEIQVVFYVGMYAVRKRYRRTQDLRAAAILTGAYGLSIVSVGMYYAGQLGIVSVRTFEDNYVGFTAFMGVMICLVVLLLSFVKPKPNSSS